MLAWMHRIERARRSSNHAQYRDNFDSVPIDAATQCLWERLTGALNQPSVDSLLWPVREGKASPKIVPARGSMVSCVFAPKEGREQTIIQTRPFFEALSRFDHDQLHKAGPQCSFKTGFTAGNGMRESHHTPKAPPANMDLMAGTGAQNTGKTTHWQNDGIAAQPPLG